MTESLYMITLNCVTSIRYFGLVEFLRNIGQNLSVPHERVLHSCRWISASSRGQVIVKMGELWVVRRRWSDIKNEKRMQSLLTLISSC